MRGQAMERGRARVRSVDELAALQARAMPTTRRVGDPVEDASMSAARPILSKINAAGFVTVDSQMGSETRTMRHRAYLFGFVARAHAPALMAELETYSGIVALAYARHGEDAPAGTESYALANLPRATLTLSRGKSETRQPLGAACTWLEVWHGLLPELQLSDDAASMAAVAKDAVQIFVFDATYGRKWHLFRKVLDALVRTKRRRSRE